MDHVEKTTAPRIHPALHVDVIACGRRIAEETFNRRQRISVGRSRRNTIILPDEKAPRSLSLFHRNASGYSLYYDDQLRGRVARSAEAPLDDLSRLRAGDTARHLRLPLAEGAHGKIELGDETLEFELVPGVEPLVVPRRWDALVAVIGALFCAAMFTWALQRRGPSPRVTLPPRVSFSRPAVAPPAPAVQLPPLTLVAGRELLGTARGRVDLGGSLRVGGAFPVPKVDEVPALPPRGSERSADGPSDYTSDGVLRPEAVVRALGRDQGALRAIYEHALRRNPAIEGDLIVRLLLNRDGSVGRVSVVRDTVTSVEVTRRVEFYLRGWHAPGPMAASAEYELPLHFRAARPERAPRK